MTKNSCGVVMLALFASLGYSQANAAVVSVDAGNYYFSYDAAAWGATFSRTGNVFTISNSDSAILHSGAIDGSRYLEFSVTAKGGNDIKNIVATTSGVVAFPESWGLGNAYSLGGYAGAWHYSTNMGIAETGSSGAFTAVPVSSGSRVANFEVSSYLMDGTGWSDNPLGFSVGTKYAIGQYGFTTFASSDGEATIRDCKVSFSIDVTGSNIAAVPEPETYAMLLAGLGLIGSIVPRKQRTQAAA